MRYIVQFLVPALIVLALALVFLRTRGKTPKADDDADTVSDGAVVLVVLIGAALAVALVVALSS